MPSNIGPENQPVYNQFKSAAINVTGTAAALTDIACGLCCLKARSTNTQRITLGIAGVTDGAGWTLAAGESTLWLPIDNLSRIVAISASGTQVLEVIYL